MVKELEKLFEEQKKLCSLRQFSFILGYNYSYLFMLRSGKRNPSQRFLRDFKDTIKKVKNLKKVVDK
jgi:hypothetical protein